MANYQDVKREYEALEWKVNSLIAMCHGAGVSLYSQKDDLILLADESFDLFKEASELEPSLEVDSLVWSILRMHYCIIIDMCNAYLFDTDPEADDD